MSRQGLIKHRSVQRRIHLKQCGSLSACHASVVSCHWTPPLLLFLSESCFHYAVLSAHLSASSLWWQMASLRFEFREPFNVSCHAKVLIIITVICICKEWPTFKMFSLASLVSRYVNHCLPNCLANWDAFVLQLTTKCAWVSLI